MSEVVVDPAPTWYAGADPETVGYLQNRGLDQKTPVEVAFEAIKAHRNAEKIIGLPADQVLRMPKDASDEAGWKTVYNRLGVPDNAADYDFSSLKAADGSGPDASFLDNMRATALALHLPKDAAAQLAKNVAEYNANQTKAQSEVAAAKLQDERAALDRSWGQHKEANMLAAKNAAKALGVSPEAIQALENQIGYSAVMEMMRNIGSKIGEDKFVTAGGVNNSIMTREGATERRAELMRDQDWVNRYLAGGFKETKEMEAVLKLMVGDDTAESRGY